MSIQPLFWSEIDLRGNFQFAKFHRGSHGCAHWLRHKTLIYKTVFLLTKRDSWLVIYHEKMMIDLLVYYGLQSEKELI